MRKYDLELGYQNLDAEDLDQLGAILEYAPDLEIFAVDGRTRVRAIQEASSAIEAVEIVVDAIYKGSPQAEPQSVEHALVSISEIAALVGLNREAVRLWTVGRRGPGKFPAPIEVLGDRVKIWSAADVWVWLDANSIPHPEGRPLSMDEVTDGTRAIERLRRRWTSRPTLTDAAHWRVAGHQATTVRVQPRKRHTS